jgi:excisionase family DNA binding protein
MSDHDVDQKSQKKPATIKCAYFSVKEYAVAVGVSEKSVRRGVDHGAIPHKRVGKLIRIPRNTIAAGA